YFPSLPLSVRIPIPGPSMTSTITPETGVLPFKVRTVPSTTPTLEDGGGLSVGGLVGTVGARPPQPKKRNKLAAVPSADRLRMNSDFYHAAATSACGHRPI